MQAIFTEAFLIGLLASMISMSVPILVAAVGETLSQRSGVLNLGVDGIMLSGAFSGFAMAYFSGSLWLGLLAALAIGALLGMIHAFISVTLGGDQVISGLAIAVLGGGLVLFFFRAFFGVTIVFPRVKGFQPIDIPWLSSLPILGPLLFHHNILVYIAFLSPFVASYFLHRTSLGLKVRGVGENPAAADALGVNVGNVRYLCVMLGGLLAGLGGAFMSLALLNMYVDDITAGRGWIAIALVIFGKWDPAKTLWGALLFGFVDAFQLRIQGLGVRIPVHLLFMLPYLLTLTVFLLMRKRTQVPAALTKPYNRGQT